MHKFTEVGRKNNILGYLFFKYSRSFQLSKKGYTKQSNSFCQVRPKNYPNCCIIFHPPQHWLPWKIVHGSVWLLGVFIWISLIFKPSLGLLLFWNVLIPIAPALLVVTTGLWRIICPLATTVLLPRHFHFSKQKKMPVKLHSIL